MTAPTDRELAQAYEQGYRDGRIVSNEMIKELVSALEQAKGAIELLNDLATPKQYMPKFYASLNKLILAAKVAQDQPATKGE